MVLSVAEDSLDKSMIKCVYLCCVAICGQERSAMLFVDEV